MSEYDRFSKNSLSQHKYDRFAANVKQKEYSFNMKPYQIINMTGLSSNIRDHAYSKDEGSLKLPNGHQWTPKDCKKEQETNAALDEELHPDIISVNLYQFMSLLKKNAVLRSHTQTERK